VGGGTGNRGGVLTTIFNSPSALVTTTGRVYPKPMSDTRHISADRPSGDVSPKEGSTANERGVTGVMVLV
jgi:hypothetical protein